MLGANWRECYARQRVNTCDSCWTVKRRERRLRDPEAARSYHHKWRRENPNKTRQYADKYQYGLMPGDRERLSAYQKGACYLCDGPLPSSLAAACVDHCHTTGLVRGLACQDCNVGIGRLRENPALIAQIALRLQDAHKYPAVILNIGQNGVGQQCDQD